MNTRTARIVSFVFSISALVIAGFYFMSSNKDELKPLLYVGLALVLVSLIFRNLIRFKPEWFGDKSTGEESEANKNDEKG
jgi:predicted membrane chloride channel (bestrophin family)